jgi:hypothetical protein
MKWSNPFAARPAIESSTQQHAKAERAQIIQHRDAVLDHLETAVVDANGKRFKEREIITTMKTVSRL